MHRVPCEQLWILPLELEYMVQIALESSSTQIDQSVALTTSRFRVHPLYSLLSK
jgi:hypothetical protein